MKKIITLSLIALATAAFAEVMDRPGGIKIGSRMTLRPYVSLSYTYDTNTKSSESNATKSGSWNISPAAELSYDHENWGLDANVFYSYHAYEKKNSSTKNHSYGESLSWHWADSSMNEKGWSLMLMENYHMTLQDDDMTNSGGQGYGRDRQQLTLNAAAERRMTDKFHLGLNGGYYWLDYKNNGDKYRPLYGWSRWTVGADIGYAFSRWTDVIIAGTYQSYDQDNDTNLDNGGNTLAKDGKSISSDSESYSLQAGIQTRATERISYRLLTGWSRFEYAGGAYTSDGWIYTASGNWRHTDTLSSALMASSYYQPSETSYGGANRTDQISWGVQKSLLSSKLNATFDIAYRRSERVYTTYRNGAKPVDNNLSYRFGLNYTLNRFASIYGSAEYSQFTQSKGNGKDYDRIRGTVGVRLTY